MRLNKESRKIITATSILIGTVVGAGILGMPYVTAQSGFIVVLGYLLIFGALEVVNVAGGM